MEKAYVVMFPIELILFTLLSFGLMKLKNKFPNIMFPPAEISIFLPP
jgi:hypothetical protein